MKTIFNLIALFTLFAFSTNCNIDELRFLEGTWKMENKENYETWKSISKTELEGSSYKIKANQKIVSEYLSIKKVDGKIIYTAKVLNQNNAQPIDFVLNKEITNKISFENVTHDFPKKIQYTKLDETTIYVEVLGENDKGFSYKIMKQK
ncbi:DUF6265 family protein [Flavobacterium sp.]|uniref:DUF6265 family protein n=1 Tax=Flavobacterium sp. TaxID=239 RepID=UPI00286E24B0|nr:DUF6265 family protein [Flavobacterium sp.]